MVLAGKLITELGIKTPAERFFKLFTSEIHQMQNLCERVHETKLHQGDEWHDTDSVKHWTYVIGNFLIQLININKIILFVLNFLNIIRPFIIAYFRKNNHFNFFCICLL
jgi:hypothetical protein